MKALADLHQTARFFIMLIIMSAACYMIYLMMVVGDTNKSAQTERIAETIDKALVQCYALEGRYPSDIDYLARYGIIIDKTKYIYHYEIMAVNMKPSVMVFEK